MSAFIVSSDHVAVIVNSGLVDCHDPLTWYFGNPQRSGKLDHTNAEEIGQMLWEENHRSVNFRYREQAETLEYRHVFHVTRPGIEALKLIHSYEYQSCEHDGWESSEAKAFCDYLARRLINRLPEYQAAKWSI